MKKKMSDEIQSSSDMKEEPPIAVTVAPTKAPTVATTTTPSFQDLRVRICTWNVGGEEPNEQTDFSSFIFGTIGENDLGIDIFVFAFQELNFRIDSYLSSLVTDDAWTAAIEKYLSPRDYVKLSSIRMCVMMTVVFVRRRHLPHIRGLLTSYTRTGFRGLFGNKGGVTVRFSIYGRDVVFVGTHLSAHLHNAEERITDFSAIFYEQVFHTTAASSPPPKASKTLRLRNLLDHDYVFVFGDLNFRLDDLSRDEVLRRLETVGEEGRVDLEELLRHDQLTKYSKKESILADFEESSIAFLPTYRFDKGTDVYDTSAKLRKPAWCDRIIWRVRPASASRHGDDDDDDDDDENVDNNKSMENLERNGAVGTDRLRATPEEYSSRAEYRLSDHKPVALNVSLRVDISSSSSSTVLFRPVDEVEWKLGRDAVCRFSIIDGDAIEDAWDWVGLFRSNFKSLADYATWKYATSAIAVAKKDNDNGDGGGKKTFALTFYAKYVVDRGPHLLIYVSKNCVMGCSEVFNIV